MGFIGAIVAVATIGGFLFGYDSGAVNGTQPGLTAAFGLVPESFSPGNGLAFTVASLLGGVSGFLYMVVIQYTSPETLSFGHSITLVASMVIGGAGSIIGSLLGGAYYVLTPQLTNLIDPGLTAVLQGAILLIVLFVLPGGLVSLPRLFRRRRQGQGGGAAAAKAAASTAGVPSTTAPDGTDLSTHPPTESEERRQDT